MKTRRRDQAGAILLITLAFTVIAAIGLGAFLHLIKTQVTQVRTQSCSTQAFFAAEVGLEKAIRILKDDLYYTPEGEPPSGGGPGGSPEETRGGGWAKKHARAEAGATGAPPSPLPSPVEGEGIVFRRLA